MENALPQICKELRYEEKTQILALSIYQRAEVKISLSKKSLIAGSAFLAGLLTKQQRSQETVAEVCDLAPSTVAETAKKILKNIDLNEEINNVQNFKYRAFLKKYSYIGA